jgi:hypothetical protein
VVGTRGSDGHHRRTGGRHQRRRPGGQTPRDELAHANEQDTRELRANLATFARRTGNPDIRKLVSNVLAGRRNVREVFRTPEFRAGAGTHLDKIEQGLSQLSDEERARAFDQTRSTTPQSTLDALRDAHDPGGPLLPPEPKTGSNEQRTYLNRAQADYPTPRPTPNARAGSR